jgi:hypothetical protein
MKKPEKFSPRENATTLFGDHTRETFQALFKHVGLEYQPTYIQQMTEFLKLYDCLDSVKEAVFSGKNQSNLADQTHQFLIFTGLLQGCLLRPATSERVDILDPKNLDLAALKTCAKTLGMVDEIHPQLKKYSRVIVLGAFQSRTELRMLYLIHLFQTQAISGVKHILLSVGDRALRDFEPAKALGAKTELEMAKVVVDQLKVKFSDLFQDITVDFHNAQKKPEASRAHTDDAALETSKMYDQQEPVLIISNQPFICYQHQTHVQAFAPTPVETIGEASDPNYNGWNYCDAFSRLMYCAALRHLVIDCQMDQTGARNLINNYKAQYRCDSLLYQNGELRSGLLVDKSEDPPINQSASKPL